jgi:hypothetical protein
MDSTSCRPNVALELPHVTDASSPCLNRFMMPTGLCAGRLGSSELRAGFFTKLATIPMS